MLSRQHTLTNSELTIQYDRLLLSIAPNCLEPIPFHQLVQLQYKLPSANTRILPMEILDLIKAIIELLKRIFGWCARLQCF